MKITINWKEIDNEEKFYDVFLPQVKAPNWHGRNLAALNDSLVTGDINELEPPYSIININTSSAKEEITDFQREVLYIFSDAAMENKGIEVTIK